jgi:gamma-glutamylcyclotransferase (GGCT)/AIG2-like uncharacterized protein YtfP
MCSRPYRPLGLPIYLARVPAAPFGILPALLASRLIRREHNRAGNRRRYGSRSLAIRRNRNRSETTMKVVPHLLLNWHAILEALRWVLRHLNTHKDAITIIVLLPTALWTFWLYRKSKKKESAEWLHTLFTNFYLSKDVDPLRTAIEFDSETKLRPVIERMLIDEDAGANEEERRVLCDIDTLLNYFEFILYLERQKQIKQSDCDKLFSYWFSLLKKPDLAYLRLYCERFGYEEICRTITGRKTCSDVPEYIAFYGSLMKSGGTQEKLKVDDYLENQGPCEIRGRLCDLGEYPDLVKGNDRVKAELYKVKDLRVFPLLDKYEEFDIHNLERSLFVRHVVRLEEPQLDAWVYFYNRSINSSLDPLPNPSLEGKAEGQKSSSSPLASQAG